MLTCDSVREILPGLAAGEAAASELHEHLQACESCRAESERLVADLTQIRRDLAGLSPSPFLESRVLEALDATPTKRSAARSSLRWGMLAGLAAACLLAAVLILASREPEPGSVPDTLPGEEEDGAATIPSQVEIPPSAAQVDFARRASAERGEVVDRFYDLAGAPPPGLALLGKGLLDRLGAPWRKANGARQYLQIWVLNPRSGAKALVLAQVSRLYTGTLLLEEPLARALGLHEHELRGEVTIAGDLSAKAYRARARLRLDTLDAEVEIQVRAAGEPPIAEIVPDVGLRREHGVVFTGERPHMGFAGETVAVRHMHGEIFPMAAHNVPWRKNDTPHIGPLLHIRSMKPGTMSVLPTQMMLEYRGDGLETCYVALPALDFGAGAPQQRHMRMQRVNLRERFEPGAAIAVARVWRGATAIPSRESAAFTLADAKGRVSFVRTGGERGPLRVRERRKDGSVHWHRIDLESLEKDLPVQKERLTIAIQKSGVVFTGHQRHTLLLENGARNPAGVAALVRELAEHAKRAGYEEDGTVSKLEVAILGYPDAPWRMAQHVMMACAAPSVRVIKLRFLRRGERPGITYELPRDQGLRRDLDEANKNTERARLVFLARDGVLHWRGLEAGNKLGESLPLESSWSILEARLDALVKRVHARKQRLVIRITALAPGMPFAPVRRAIGLCQDAGADDILLEGRAEPKPPR